MRRKRLEQARRFSVWHGFRAAHTRRAGEAHTHTHTAGHKQKHLQHTHSGSLWRGETSCGGTKRNECVWAEALWRGRDGVFIPSGKRLCMGTRSATPGAFYSFCLAVMDGWMGHTINMARTWSFSPLLANNTHKQSIDIQTEPSAPASRPHFSLSPSRLNQFAISPSHLAHCAFSGEQNTESKEKHDAAVPQLTTPSRPLWAKRRSTSCEFTCSSGIRAYTHLLNLLLSRSVDQKLSTSVFSTRSWVEDFSG